MSILVHTQHSLSSLPVNGQKNKYYASNASELSVGEYVSFDIEKIGSDNITSEDLAVLSETEMASIENGSSYQTQFNEKDIFYTYLYDDVRYSLLIENNGGVKTIKSIVVDPLPAGYYISGVSLDSNRLVMIYMIDETKEVVLVTVTFVGNKLYFYNMGTWINYAVIDRGNDRKNRQCVTTKLDDTHIGVAVCYGTGQPALFAEIEINNLKFTAGNFIVLNKAKNLDIFNVDTIDRNNVLASCYDSQDDVLTFYHIQKSNSVWQVFKTFTQTYTTMVDVNAVDANTYLVYSRVTTSGVTTVSAQVLRYINNTFTISAKFSISSITMYCADSAYIDESHILVSAIMSGNDYYGLVLTLNTSNYSITGCSTFLVWGDNDFSSYDNITQIIDGRQILWFGIKSKKEANMQSRIVLSSYIYDGSNISQTGSFSNYRNVVVPSKDHSYYYGVALSSAKAGSQLYVYTNV